MTTKKRANAKTPKVVPMPTKQPAEQPAQTMTFLVDGGVLQKTVEFLASFQLAHPASVQRDQLIGYYTSLKAIETMKADEDSGKT